MLIYVLARVIKKRPEMNFEINHELYRVNRSNVI